MVRCYQSGVHAKEAWVGCHQSGVQAKEAWVRLVQLHLHLWGKELFKRVGIIVWVLWQWMKILN